MQQQLTLITLGVADLARSRRFYCDGFGWQPVFQNDQIAFYLGKVKSRGTLRME